MRFESKEGSKKKGKNKNKNPFCKLEFLIFFWGYFFITHFPLHFKDDL
jgi:hypothetical protein